MKIVFVSFYGPNYRWNGRSFANGIGGSEGCMIRLAEEFAAMGHDVTAFVDCFGIEEKYNGVEYVRLSNYNTSNLPNEADLLISNRHWKSLIGMGAKRKWLWSHDVPYEMHHPMPHELGEALKCVDKIIYLNRYHRSISPWWPEDRCAVIPVGVENNHPSAIPVRDPWRCITLYNPNRGLSALRNIWKDVHSVLPQATLASYWWEPLSDYPANPEIGIEPMRRLNQAGLLEESYKSGLAPYICQFPYEISPVSMILPQVAGCIPVYVPQAGMVDACRYGVRTTYLRFAETLIWALQQNAAGAFDAARKVMSTDMSIYHDWKNVAIQWIDECNKVALPMHLGGHQNETHIDAGALDYMVSRFGTKSMIDIGCGPGGMVELACSMGIESMGIDGDYTLVRSNPERYIIHDYTTGPYVPSREFDLAWSVEFLEHVEELFIENYMASFSKCKHVICTHAKPGQTGHHHVNERDKSYWVDMFKRYGFSFDAESTEGVRSKSTMKQNYMRENGLVFVRN